MTPLEARAREIAEEIVAQKACDQDWDTMTTTLATTMVALAKEFAEKALRSICYETDDGDDFTLPEEAIESAIAAAERGE